jgi:hypothetical protein
VHCNKNFPVHPFPCDACHGLQIPTLFRER